MRRSIAVNVIWVYLVLLIANRSFCEEEGECPDCDANTCEPPRNCRAGMVKDACDCCYLCGAKEGDRCDHQELNSESGGRCGENLECRIRNDLDWDDPPEAVCVCKQQTPLCGSDGVTYDNICQFTEARYSKRNGLRAISSEPCVKRAKIRSPPQNIRNITGSYVALTCEASGWPVPDIRWVQKQHEQEIKLPGNNTDVAIQSRNGPNKDETTSWLLFFRLSKENEGTYVCRAQNYAGSDSASSTVSVVP